MSKVVTGNARLSYVNLVVPKAMVEGQPEKYSVQVLIPKTDTKTIEAIKKAVEDAIKEGIATKFSGKRPATLKLPLRDGDAEYPDRPEMEGMMFFNANNARKPRVVDIDRQDIIDPAEIYSGMWGRVAVNVYAFSGTGSKGVAMSLQAVQKTKDDERLDGSSCNVDELFDKPLG